MSSLNLNTEFAFADPVLNEIREAVFFCDPDGTILHQNSAALALGPGVMSITKLFPSLSCPLFGCATCTHSASPENPGCEYTRGDGRVYWGRKIPVLSNPTPFLSYIFEDTSHRCLAEQALRSSFINGRLRTEILNAFADPVLLYTPGTGEVLYANPAAATTLGYTVADLQAQPFYDLLAASGGKPVVVSSLQRAQTGSPVSFETLVQRQGQSPLAMEVSVQTFLLETSLRSVAVFHDSSDRKKTEMALGRANRALKIKSACSQVLSFSDTESGVVQDMCRVLNEYAEYPLAVVLYLTPDNTLVTQTISGEDSAYSRAFPSSITLNPDTLIARAISSNEVLTFHPLVSDGTLGAGPGLTQSSYHAVMARPLLLHDQTLGVLLLFSKQTTTFSAEELRVLNEYTDDLLFGIEHARLRKRVIDGAFSVERTLRAACTTSAPPGDPAVLRSALAHQLSERLTRQMKVPQHCSQALGFAAEIWQLRSVLPVGDIGLFLAEAGGDPLVVALMAQQPNTTPLATILSELFLVVGALVDLNQARVTDSILATLNIREDTKQLLLS